MRKTKLYIAMSLNGKIAKKDGSVDWLENIPNPDKSDYGYKDFYDSIDTTIQGNSTYQQIIGWGIDFPYPDKQNYVFTTNSKLINTKYVEFISENHIDFLKHLKNKKGKDIWIIGGGKLNTMLINQNMIDEIIVFIMPIILTDGIDLFRDLPEETKLELTETKSYASGAVQLKYNLK
ncbi:MAG: dihydrofolate reductase [Marinilabiliales bacterium]|nr:MAG: dihydrofolate reductase [Marinilabiliales bacterium]